MPTKRKKRATKLHIGDIVRVKGVKTRARVTYIRGASSEEPEKYRVQFKGQPYQKFFFNRGSLRKMTRKKSKSSRRKK